MMDHPMTAVPELTLDVFQTVDIEAGRDAAWKALMRRLTVDNSTMGNKPMPMVLEAWPGGRWYRDLGDQQGHLWGFVQVIKPPTLIEIHGPMFMSYAVAGHIQFRLTEIDHGTELSLRHRVLGLVPEEHRQGVATEWTAFLESIQQLIE